MEIREAIHKIEEYAKMCQRNTDGTMSEYKTHLVPGLLKAIEIIKEESRNERIGKHLMGFYRDENGNLIPPHVGGTKITKMGG